MPGPDFGEPDADWTEEYAWTRYRGPQPWPCPADWVLAEPEAGGAMWYRYPGVGEGLQTDDDVFDAFEPDYDEMDDARQESAFLGQETLEMSLSQRTETVEWKLTIAGDTVFRRVEPDYDEVIAVTAEALSRYANERALDDVAPESGRLPDDILEEQQIEQRKEENESLGDFDG